jgi:hypothetical protein
VRGNAPNLISVYRPRVPLRRLPNDADPDNARFPKGQPRFLQRRTRQRDKQRWVCVGFGGDGRIGFLDGLERVHNGVHNKR